MCMHKHCTYLTRWPKLDGYVAGHGPLKEDTLSYQSFQWCHDGTVSHAQSIQDFFPLWDRSLDGCLCGTWCVLYNHIGKLDDQHRRNKNSTDCYTIMENAWQLFFHLHPGSWWGVLGHPWSCVALWRHISMRVPVECTQDLSGFGRDDACGTGAPCRWKRWQQST